MHTTTQERVQLQLNPQFDTQLDHSYSLHKATYNWNHKNHGYKKNPRIAETRGRRVWTSPYLRNGG